MNDEEGLLVFFMGIAVGCLIGFVAPKYFSAKQSAPQNTSRIAAVNKETWEWTDWKGRKRTITVHREVKYLE